LSGLLLARYDSLKGPLNLNRTNVLLKFDLLQAFPGDRDPALVLLLIDLA